MFSKLHFVKCAKCYLHRDNRSMYKSTMMFWYSSLNDSFNCQGEVPQQLTISCLLVSTWQSCRGSESSHFCRLQAHRWCLRLPEWGRGGWRYPHYDQGWCGQKRGSFYCKQGELLVQKVPFFLFGFFKDFILNWWPVRPLCVLSFPSCGVLFMKSPWSGRVVRRLSVILNWTT